MTTVTISAVPDARQADTARQIERELLRALAVTNRQTVNASVVQTAVAADGRLIGGVTGATSYGWLLIKTLWVEEAYRGSGIGTALMHAAEAEGRRLAAHSAWLDTSSAAAARFYQRIGYAEFGRLENRPDQEPEGHRRWFLRKTL